MGPPIFATYIYVINIGGGNGGPWYLPFVCDTLIFSFHHNEVQLLLGHELQLIPPNLSSLSCCVVVFLLYVAFDDLATFITHLSVFIIVAVTQA